MGLSSSYVLSPNRIPDVFSKLRDGQAPDQLTTQLLKDWGFASSNDRAFIPLLKSLGFLSSDGKPTQRYHEYRNHSKSKLVMGDAIREAYSDLFLISANPTQSDKTAFIGKFKSFHNATDNVAQLMASTFFAILNLADLSGSAAPSNGSQISPTDSPAPPISGQQFKGSSPSLHYNIQIHLPATKDVEVFNAIFKSIKEHLIER